METPVDVKAQRLDSIVVVFDSDCVLCSSAVQLLLNLDRHQHFLFTDFHSNWSRSHVPAELVPLRLIQKTADGIDLAAPDTILVKSASGIWFTESAAVLYLLSKCGLLFKLIAKLLTLLPKSLLDCLYRLIARRRYRWFGRREVCYRPNEQVRARFLS